MQVVVTCDHTLLLSSAAGNRNPKTSGRGVPASVQVVVTWADAAARGATRNSSALTYTT